MADESNVIFSTYNDLYAARSIGLSLGKPTAHFVRLLRLFPPDGRLALLRDAYDSAKPLYKGYFTLAQFVAFMLFALDPREDIPDALNVGTPTSVRPEKLTTKQRSAIDAVLSGANEGLVATLLIRASLGDARSIESELLRVLAQSLGSRIDDARLAAGIAQCLLFNQKLFDSYKDETTELVGFATSVSREQFEAYDDDDDDDYCSVDSRWHFVDLLDTQGPDVELDRSMFDKLTRDVSDIVEKDVLSSASELNRELLNDLALAEKFGFVESASGLFIPSHAGKNISVQFARSYPKSSLLSVEIGG
jgi:hypothetical protein